MHDIEMIQTQIADVKRHEHVTLPIQPHDIHQFTVGYVALAVGIIAIIIYCWTKCRPLSPAIKEIIPTPTPRTTLQQTSHRSPQRSPQTFEFNIDQLV